MKSRRLLATAAVLAICVGCVSKSKHDKTTAALKACESKRDKLAKDLDALQKEVEQKLSATEEELSELRRQREAQNKQLELFQKFTEKLKSMIDVGDINVSIRRGRMVVGMPSRILFPSGKHELSKRGKRTLTRVGKALAELPERRFLVAGHTDNMPIGEKLKETYQDNWDLSAERALTVTRYLIEAGVPPENLAAVGYGAYDPAASNNSKGGRKRNRRIELIVEPELAELPKVPKELM